MTDDLVDVVVVGAGIAGLVVARDIAAAGRSVVLLEAGERAGGLLRSGDLDGVAIDVGAESFATRTTGVAELVADLAADEVDSADERRLRIADPAPGGAHLVVTADGALVRAPLPHRTVLGIPADPLADDVVRIIGAEAAARAAAEVRAEPLPAGAGPSPAEPSLADLVAARCGPLLVDRLVDPLCRSVYSVAASDARLSRLHPALWREFTARGSLIEAAGAIAAPLRAGAAVAGIEGGMWRLAAAVEASALAHGARILLDAAVDEIVVDPAGTGPLSVRSGSATVEARRLVIATGSAAARRLLNQPPAPASAVRVVAALVDSPALDGAPVGSGVIVGADVPSAAKALTHVDAKWPWMAASLSSGHSARHVVRLSARVADAPGLESPDDIAREISLLAGADVEAGDVVASTSALWTDAVASRPVGVADEEQLRARGIELAGASVAGTGLASVIPHARTLARRLVDATAPTTAGTPHVSATIAPTSRRNA